MITTPFQNKKSAIRQRTKARNTASSMRVFGSADRLGFISPFTVSRPIITNGVACEPREAHNGTNGVRRKGAINFQRLFVSCPHCLSIAGNGKRLKAVVTIVVLLNGRNGSATCLRSSRRIVFPNERTSLAIDVKPDRIELIVRVVYGIKQIAPCIGYAANLFSTIGETIA